MVERATKFRLISWVLREDNAGGQVMVDDIREYSLPQGFTEEKQAKSHRRKIVTEFGRMLDERCEITKPISRIDLEFLN